MNYDDQYFQQDLFMDQLMAPPPPVAEYGYASGYDNNGYDNGYDNSYTTEYVTTYTNDFDTGYSTSYDTVYTNDTPYLYPYPYWGWHGYNGWYDDRYPRSYSYSHYDGVTAVMLVVIMLFVIAVILMYMDDDGLCDTVYGTVLDPRCKKHVSNGNEDYLFCDQI
ncbi:hypothetical protein YASMINEVIRUS_625 [Yasminevirus sp. GU-2018]|uniref:Uncharacterized protein n=1 Tax=Yasminevirus sp. GU-2018 TaxID=2420051 RepID=A0A5K0U9M4_9VIRU|nr:hypothetical protein YASMINEVIRUS_625 [Yasminevirus sp. GU-2018]